MRRPFQTIVIGLSTGIVERVSASFSRCYPKPMASAKQDVANLLNRLPEDCTIEDIQYHLYVLDRIRQGIEAAESGQTVSQEEVEASLKKWLAD